MTTLIGLIMFYTWGHLVVMIFRDFYKKMDKYEKAISVIAVVSFFLYVLGTINQ